MSWHEIRRLCIQRIASNWTSITLPVDQVLTIPKVILDTVRRLAGAGIMAWYDHDLDRMRQIFEQLAGRMPCADLDQYQGLTCAKCGKPISLAADATMAFVWDTGDEGVSFVCAACAGVDDPTAHNAIGALENPRW